MTSEALALSRALSVASEVGLLQDLGFASLLMVPIVAEGRSIGLLEAYRRLEEPWSRVEMHRARLMALQLAFFVQHMGPSESHALAAASI